MLYQNFTTSNIDFVVRFFGYDNMENLLADQEDAPSVRSCNRMLLR